LLLNGHNFHDEPCAPDGAAKIQARPVAPRKRFCDRVNGDFSS